MSHGPLKMIRTPSELIVHGRHGPRRRLASRSLTPWQHLNTNAAKFTAQSRGSESPPNQGST